jgi:transcriptional regulator with XRE-family HTH domain
MGFLEKIEHLRQQKGLTQGQVESGASLPQGRISKWKDGRGVPDLDHIRRLAVALQCSVAYLADDEIDDPLLLPRLTDAEQEAVDFVRALGLTKVDVKRIFAAKPPPVTPRSRVKAAGRNRGTGKAREA